MIPLENNSIFWGYWLKMIKKLLTVILLLFILPFVSAAGDISVSPGSDTITANVGQQITKSITLSNSGATSWLVTLPGTINFAGTGHNLNNIAVSYNVSGSSVNISSSSSKTINYLFTVPADAYAAAYNGILNFTTASANDYAPLSLSLNVNAVHSISANNITLDIAQGQTGTATLTLANNGNIDETASLPSTVTLTSTTNAANTLTASIAKTSLDVDYTGANSTTATINIPANAAKETYKGNVGITYSGLTVSPLITVDVVAPSYNLNTGTIAFPLADPNATVLTTFAIQNTGNAALTNLVLSSNVASQYNLVFDQTAPFNLGINQSRSIKASVFVPYRETIGNRSIGAISIQSDQKNFSSAYNVYIDLESKLDISDLDIIIDGDQESDVVDGEKIGKNAKPSSEMELRIRVQNNFKKESDIDIDDITIRATLMDSDEEEIDEAEIDLGNLEADENSDDKSIMFNIPLDVKDEKHIIEINIDGDDDNGVSHNLKWRVYFDIEKKSHEIVISKAYLTPESVKCTRTASLNIELMNIGATTEDEVRLSIVNNDLGINVDKKDIELNRNPESSDNTYEETVGIDAKDKAAGTYPITIRAYYGETLLDDIKTVNLVVEDCKAPVAPKKNETTVVVQQPTQQQPEQNITITAGEEIPTTTEASFMQSTGGIILLVLGNIAVIGIVIGVVAKLLLVPRIPKP